MITSTTTLISGNERKKQRYAFFCCQEDPSVNWYISPPVDELNEYDNHLVKLIVEKNGKDEVLDSLKYTQIINLSITKDFDSHYIDADDRDEVIFPDTTIHEGCKKLGVWTLIQDENPNNISKLSKDYHLLIYEAADWN